MARPHPLRTLMNTPLPPISAQRRKLYRPSLREVYKTHALINKYIFGNKLERTTISIGRCVDFWGICYGLDTPNRYGSYCEMKISDKWYCPQWMVSTLAHEMVHQYQWEVMGKKSLIEGDINSIHLEGRYSIMNHGPSFYQWRGVMSYYDIPLCLSFGSDKWFEKQSF